MAKYGKWIGGFIGLVAGGPLGALAGFVLGSLFDETTTKSILIMIPTDMAIAPTSRQNRRPVINRVQAMRNSSATHFFSLYLFWPPILYVLMARLCTLK